ncbi:hypothetical protein QJS10_CPA03g00494 [Acorus calamus]|uniref:Uncharacterized protein n=1 Tax=Acorus calamus TaxID=4465 RepID=A0AAV9F483_ACOCL|nr:hypothetical protein QJS10_CPA03g00494 [Acorus calamus]
MKSKWTSDDGRNPLLHQQMSMKRKVDINGTRDPLLHRQDVDDNAEADVDGGRDLLLHRQMSTEIGIRFCASGCQR